MKDKAFFGKVVWITGGSKGIGLALANALADEGARLALSARGADTLKKVVSEIGRDGSKVKAYPADVTNTSSLADVVQSIEADLGPIHMHIASAGMGVEISAENLLDKLNLALMEVEVNLKGAIASVAAVLPGMMERKQGIIAGLSSLAAYRGLPGASVYCATKAGLSTFLEGLRTELYAHSIQVVDVRPGFVRTPGQGNLKRPMMLEPHEAARIIIEGIRLGRSQIAFPKPLLLAARMASLVPDKLWPY